MHALAAIGCMSAQCRCHVAGPGVRGDKEEEKEEATGRGARGRFDGVSSRLLVDVLCFEDCWEEGDGGKLLLLW